MADPDISDYEFDADDLLLMPSWKREILHVQQYTKIIKIPTLKTYFS